MEFVLNHRCKKTSARAGVIKTDMGLIKTPIFMPVGTAATVKGIHQKDLDEDICPDIILANTYHLFLRPGTEIIKGAGGIHKFMSWEKPILTDSGGYQVYSLSKKRKISEEGVSFQSHIDGSRCFFSPENVIDAQRAIGSNIIMAFDECPPYPSTSPYIKDSMELTHRWLERCIKRFDETKKMYEQSQVLFPIVQGGISKYFRQKSAEYIAKKNLFGNAIGGLSVGEPSDLMYEMVEITNKILPYDKPRYLMGVGTPINILENISLGVDMFDCVMPTRNARNGMLFTSEGFINIKNKKWESDYSKIETMDNKGYENQYSKAYLRHLFTANEILGGQIATIHNLNFYNILLKIAREKIMAGEFASWKNSMVKKLNTRI